MVLYFVNTESLQAMFLLTQIRRQIDKHRRSVVAAALFVKHNYIAYFTTALTVHSRSAAPSLTAGGPATNTWAPLC